MPYAQHINAQALGFLVGSSPVTEGMVTQAINSNQISVSYMFVPDQNRTVTSVKIYCPSRGGTGGTLDAQIRTDNNGQPSGTVITGGGTVSSAIPLPPAWVTL